MKLKRKKHNHYKAKKGFNSWRSGIWAEYLVLIWLSLKLYRIIARRKITPYGEVDLVAIQRNSLILVEVKLRRTINDALESVSTRQQQRLTRAADWLYSHYHHRNFHTTRIDLVALSWRRWPVHIIDVFRR